MGQSQSKRLRSQGMNTTTGTSGNEGRYSRGVQVGRSKGGAILVGSGSRTPVTRGRAAGTAGTGARLELPRNANGTVNMRAIRQSNTRNRNKNKKK